MHYWKRWAGSMMAALCLSCAARAAENETAPVVLALDAAAGKLYRLDGGSFDLLQQTDFGYPLNDAVAVAPDGGSAYVSSPQGWVVKLDLRSGQTRAARVAQDTAALALSHDGRYLMAANRAPGTLVALDAATLAPLRVLEAKDKQGKGSAVADIRTLPGRSSFIAVMRDIPELWELSYDERAEPIFEGMVHDYKMGEGLALKGPFPPRRTVLDPPLAHFYFDPSSAHVVGAGPGGLLQVIHLDIRRKIRELRLDGAPQPGDGVRIDWQGAPALLLPQQDGALLSVLDLRAWQVLRQLPSGAAIRRLVSHDRAAYAWAIGDDARVRILDKRSLAFLPAISPALENASAPLAWTQDGKFAVLLERGGGALLVCDAATLEIARRVPLR
jgi:hypothetical protein